MAGLYLDPWEKLVLDQMLSERDVFYYNELLDRDMRTFSCFEFGLVVARQNGKGSILEARELAGLFLLGERLIIHSAHEFPTSVEAFQRIEALISGDPELKKEVKKIAWSHGSEGIEMRNGQRLLFKTRTKGGARGFTCDALILDEAMTGLSAASVGAMLPTLSARPNPQVLYTGSSGDKDSEQLGRVRNRGIKKSDPRLGYMEWSIDACTDFCPPDCKDHDRQDIVDEYRMSQEELKRAQDQLVESYKKANPGLGIRISVEHIESERRSMGKEEFARERLGVGDWPVEGDAWSVIDEESWRARVNSVSAPQNPLVFGIDVTPDCSYACIAAGGFNGEEIGDTKQIHVEVTQDGSRYDHRAGRLWVVDRMLDLCKNHRPYAVVIDKGSQAGPLFDELEAPLANLGIQLLAPTMREYAQGCGMFHGAVVPRRGNAPQLVHLDQPMLTAAVAGAEKRDLSDLWAWDKRNASTDISPLVACTHVLWGVHKMETMPRRSAPWVMRG